MARILVSGFEPFLNEKVNPTAEIANFVDTCPLEARIGWSHHEVRGIVLPVEFDRSFQVLEQVWRDFQPDVILSFGLAAGRSTIDIEQVAVNGRGNHTGAVNIEAGIQKPEAASPNVSRPDNAGVIGQGVIDISAPESLPTTLPTDLFLQALSDADIPARRSFDAGTYVCNDLFFQMQNRLRGTGVRSGFIHVPRFAAEWPWSRFEIAVHAILSSNGNP